MLAGCKCEKPLVLSIAAGISFAKIENALGADTPIIRAMPNTPLMLGVGATQLVKNAAANEEQLAEVRGLFDAMGVTTVFEREDMINEAIPYAGSAPAYIYAYADAMVQSAKKHGIDEKDALQMFCQTMIGAAKMLMQGDKTPAELRRAVCRCLRSATSTAWSRRRATSARRGRMSSANKNFRFFEKTG